MKQMDKGKADYKKGFKELPKSADLKVTGGACKVCDSMKPKILPMGKSKGKK